MKMWSQSCANSDMKYTISAILLMEKEGSCGRIWTRISRNGQ